MVDMNNNENKSGSDIDSLIRQNEFGTRFRIARESAGLSIAEASDELRLSEDIIRALENSQLDSLPAPTFTQGYIRSYAKLLKLPADEILKAYDQLIPEKDSPLVARTGISTQADSNDLIIKLVSIGFLVAALVLLAFWFQQADFNFLKPDAIEDQSSESEVIPEHIQRMDNNELVNDSVLVVDTSPETETEIIVEETAEQVVPNENSEISNEPPAAFETEPEDVETVQPESNPQPELEQGINNAEPVTVNRLKARITEKAQGNDVLVMATASESWAEVEDANGARLFFDLMKKDNEYKIRGKAPFKLFLGNAPSVSLGVNNRLINVSDYVRRNNIAHVEISAKGDVSALSRRMMSQDMIEKINNTDSDPQVEQ